MVIGALKKRLRLMVGNRRDSAVGQPQEGRPVAGPEHVVIDITNRCNEQCMGCWLYSPLLKNKPSEECLGREINFEKAKELISCLAGLGTRRIRFTGGGEPLMHPKIMQLIEFTKSQGLLCGITTNFSLCNEGRVRDLIRLGVDELAVSLWAADEETYAKTHYRVMPGTFDRIVSNLRVLTREKKDRPFLTLCNVICSLNYSQVRRMFEFALQVKADGAYFTLIDALEGTDALLLNAPQKESVLRQAGEIQAAWRGLPSQERIKLDYFDGLISRLKEEGSLAGDYDRSRVNQIPCLVGWIFARVLADGNVVPCCRAVTKPMGNINSRDFKAIWHGRAYAEFRVKARYLPKTDPYFEEIGCVKMCDNLMHSEEAISRINGLEGRIDSLRNIK